MRKFYKSFCILVAFFIIVVFPASVFALTDNVFDYAELLTVSENNEIQDSIYPIMEETGMDVVILTTNDTEGKTSRAYADDYYDFNGRGVGSDDNGILMLINMDEREIWLSTYGSAIRYFTDARIEAMLDKITDHMADQDYYGACTTFVSEVSRYYKAGVPSNQYTEEEVTIQSRLVKSAKRLPFYILGALAVGGIVVGIMILTNKSKATVDHSTYMNRSKFNLKNQSDRFLYKTHTHRRIQTDSGGGSGGSSGGGSSSGRSTTHRSSSGRSHGGGGRKF